ncbi:hypothetical protein LTR53_019959, partial [Teratosphaeriaceae sp. CCFEE 6253]
MVPLPSSQQQGEDGGLGMLGGMVGAGGLESGYAVQTPGMGGEGGYFGNPYGDNTSRDNLLMGQQAPGTAPSRMGARSLAPTQAYTHHSVAVGDYGLGHKGDADEGI